jgi:hypothetical protein
MSRTLQTVTDAEPNIARYRYAVMNYPLLQVFQTALLGEDKGILFPEYIQIYVTWKLTALQVTAAATSAVLPFAHGECSSLLELQCTHL